MAEMDRHTFGVNFGTLVGLNTIRRSIVADKQKIGKIKILLESSLKQGAFGLSTNFSLNDFDFFEEEELVDIFKINQADNSVVKHHLEDEGQNILPASFKINQYRESVWRKNAPFSLQSHWKKFLELFFQSA